MNNYIYNFNKLSLLTNTKIHLIFKRLIWFFILLKKIIYMIIINNNNY